jgi:ABC-2 type transport system ATP-binding protein
MPYALEIEGLTKRFGNKTVVDDISFSVEEGEVFGFLGPNGSGKTTTIRTALGILRQDAG